MHYTLGRLDSIIPIATDQDASSPSLETRLGTFIDVLVGSKRLSEPNMRDDRLYMYIRTRQLRRRIIFLFDPWHQESHIHAFIR
jgi:hypothetical protein